MSHTSQILTVFACHTPQYLVFLLRNTNSCRLDELGEVTQMCSPQLDYEFSHILCMHLPGGRCYKKFSYFFVQIGNICMPHESYNMTTSYGLKWYLQLDMYQVFRFINIFCCTVLIEVLYYKYWFGQQDLSHTRLTFFHHISKNSVKLIEKRPVIIIFKVNIVVKLLS